MVNQAPPENTDFEAGITGTSHLFASVLYNLMHDACRRLCAVCVLLLPKGATPDHPLFGTIRAIRQEAEDVPLDDVEAWKAKRRDFNDRWRVLRDARIERDRATRARSKEAFDGSDA